MHRVHLVTMLAAAGLLACACSGSLDSKARSSVLSLGESAELGTVEYVLHTVIRNEDAFAEQFKPGARKILFSCTAYLKAGVDLSGFDGSKVKVDSKGGEASVTLPKAKLLSCNIPEEEIVLEYSHVDFFRQSFTPEEKHAMKRKAEAEIMARVPDLGICEEAEANARQVIQLLLEPLGFSKVNVEFE